MKIYSDNLAKLIDPSYHSLADVLKEEIMDDALGDYDILEGARRYENALDDKLNGFGLLVTGDGKAYIYDGAEPDDDMIKKAIQQIDTGEIIDSVDITIKNSWGYTYHPYQWPAIVQMMDDDIREEMADDDTYNTNQKFFIEYAKRHYAKFDEEWELDKEIPVW